MTDGEKHQRIFDDENEGRNRGRSTSTSASFFGTWTKTMGRRPTWQHSLDGGWCAFYFVPFLFLTCMSVCRSLLLASGVGMEPRSVLYHRRLANENWILMMLVECVYQ